MRTLLFTLLLTPSILFASLQEANVAYESGEFETALDLFSEANTDSSSAGLLFNIGNCHFKLNHLPKAILFYERAAKLAPSDEDIRSNLKYAQRSVVDQIAELPSLEIGNYWNRLKAGSGVDQWARTSLFTVLLAFLALAAMLFIHGKAKKLVLGVAVSFFLITAFSMYMAASQRSAVLHGSEAIIMDSRVEIKSAPGDGGTKLFVLHEGTKVELLRSEAEWSEIRLSNGKVGWVRSEGIEVI